MIIEKVNTAVFGADGEVIFSIVIRDDETSPIETADYAYRSDDPYSGTTGEYFKDWIVANPDKILPYAQPSEPTIEEIRAAMPVLTARQFWMAAAHIDVDKDVLINLIKANFEDSIERKMMLAELETSNFERLNPTVIDLMALMEITAEQVDDLWVWAAGI